MTIEKAGYLGLSLYYQSLLSAFLIKATQVEYTDVTRTSVVLLG